MANEHASNRLERVAESLVRGAARRSPPGLAARLEEEWLADFATRRNAVSRLRFALGCFWATHVIALESARPLAASAGGGGAWSSTSFRDEGGSRRFPMFLLVVVLHAAALYGFLAVRQTYLKPIEPRFVVTPVPEARPQPPPLPPPESPTTVKTKVELPPITETAVTSDTKEGVIPEPWAPPVDPPRETPPPPKVTRLPGGPGNGFPAPDDYYPSASIYERESGATTVRVCVNGSGRLTAAPALQESSGVARLDGAALRLAHDASGHYRPTTENGSPVADCYPLRIRFQLKN